LIQIQYTLGYGTAVIDATLTRQCS